MITGADYLLLKTHMHGFSDIVNWLGSAPGTALHFRVLGYHSIEQQVMILDKQLKDL